MTNGEKYKTAHERAEAFEKYCDVRCREDQACSVEGCRKCLLEWLDIEADASDNIIIRCPNYGVGICSRCHSDGLLTRPCPMGTDEDGQTLYSASCPCGTEFFTNLKAESESAQ